MTRTKKTSDVVHRIRWWNDYYEPGKYDRMERAMRYVKLFVYGHAPSAGFRRLHRVAGDHVHVAYAVFCKLLEVTGDEPRGPRDGTIYNHQGDPASIADMAFETMFAEPVIIEGLKYLTDGPESWVEVVPLSTWKRQHPNHEALRAEARARVGKASPGSGPGANATKTRATARSRAQSRAVTRPKRKPKPKPKPKREQERKRKTKTSTRTSTVNRNPKTETEKRPRKNPKPKREGRACAEGKQRPASASASASAQTPRRPRRPSPSGQTAHSGDGGASGVAGDAAPVASQIREHHEYDVVGNIRYVTCGRIQKSLGGHLRRAAQMRSDAQTLDNITRHVFKGHTPDECRHLADALIALAESKVHSTLKNKFAGFVAAVKRLHGPWAELERRKRK